MSVKTEKKLLELGAIKIGRVVILPYGTLKKFVHRKYWENLLVLLEHGEFIYKRMYNSIIFRYSFPVNSDPDGRHLFDVFGKELLWGIVRKLNERIPDKLNNQDYKKILVSIDAQVLPKDHHVKRVTGLDKDEIVHVQNGNTVIVKDGGIMREVVYRNSNYCQKVYKGEIQND